MRHAISTLTIVLGLVLLATVSPAQDRGADRRNQAILAEIQALKQQLTALQSKVTGIPGSWDQLLSATAADPCNSPRFRCVMGGAAVRDNETGLVWERAPTSPILNWFQSHAHCNALKTGGRLGWRLPELHELASLVDPAVTTPPHLPPGHPFQNILTNITANYTSATSVAGSPGAYTTVTFFTGEVGGGGAKGGAGGNPSWCVRGGQGPDPAQD